MRHWPPTLVRPNVADTFVPGSAGVSRRSGPTVPATSAVTLTWAGSTRVAVGVASSLRRTMVPSGFQSSAAWTVRNFRALSYAPLLAAPARRKPRGRNTGEMRKKAKVLE